MAVRRMSACGLTIDVGPVALIALAIGGIADGVLYYFFYRLGKRRGRKEVAA